jgi:hypothetical protein
MSHTDEPAAGAGASEPEAPARAGDTRVRPQPDTSPGARNMLPARERRRLGAERLLTRLVATCGIVGIGVALGAILASSKVDGWITGLVVAIVSVVLSAILWSSRQL